MKPISKDEIYENISSFLRSRGIELKPGSYTHRLQQGCGLLADSINLSQEGYKRAKVEFERNLDRMRQVIHEQTAPKSGAARTESTGTPPKAKNSARKPSSRKTGGANHKAPKRKA
jgi:hypothetical protein